MRVFIADHTSLPVSNYVPGNKSIIKRENVAQEIALHLQSIGKWVKAINIVHYTTHPQGQSMPQAKKPVSFVTARQWMGCIGYR